MNDQTNLTIMTYKTISTDIEPVIRELVTLMTGKAVGHIESHRGTASVVLVETGEMIRRQILDKMLDISIVSQILPELNGLSEKNRTDWLHRLSYSLRKVVPDLIIPVPRTMKDAPVIAWALGGVIGAFAGILIPALLNLDPQFRLTLATGASPLGALGGILAVRWVSLKTSFLIKISSMRSKDLMDPDQLRINVRNSIQSWIQAQLLIMVLLSKTIQVESSEISTEPDKMPAGLLSALTKLIQAPNDKRAAITQEIVQEFINAGYKSASEQTTLIWKELLRHKYDVLGMIQPGDECRVLLQPVTQENRIRRKGRLTRKR
ncbi:hypothetical protein K8T06_04710 [bacterium]|nr:hypothetical protein [bacterium]